MIWSTLKPNNKKRQRGFTLPEIMVYLAIFIIVSVASVGLMLSLNNFVDQYRLEAMLYRSTTNVMEQILVAVRQADQLDTVGTVEDDPDNGVLRVQSAATTTTITFDGTTLNLDINGTDYGSLLNDNISVDGFTVYHYPMSVGELVRVKVEMTATLNASTTKSMTMYGGAMVRGSL